MAAAFLALELYEGECSASYLSHFTSGDISPVAFVQEALKMIGTKYQCVTLIGCLLSTCYSLILLKSRGSSIKK
jgi:hypothetical protein